MTTDGEGAARGAQLPTACPRCWGDVVPVVWGYPNDGDFVAEQRGDVHLGGCIVPPDEPWPEWFCPRCRYYGPQAGVSPSP